MWFLYIVLREREKKEKKIHHLFWLILNNNLIFFMFIRFPAIPLVKTIESYLHEFCAQGILHNDFQ